MANCSIIPDNWKLEQDLKECCLQHDADYVAQTISRSEADYKLYQCALGKTDPLIAGIAFAVVTLGGWFFWYRRKLKKMVR